MKKFLILLFLLVSALIFTQCVNTDTKETWAIVLHGGAGSAANMSSSEREHYLDLLNQALETGTTMLEQGAQAIDVAMQVVVWMEDCPDFNAGKGAVINSDGIHELDAALMDGRDLKAGAVAGVRDIKNPILAARHVMEDTPHVLLIGEGASAFAASAGLTMVPNDYFSTPKRLEQIRRIREQKENPDPKGTVGCVVLDKNGNLAAATSTGGMSGKRWGRVGDVPIIGAGTYANNNTVAVSGTGHGELWIRRCVAFDISALMDYKGYSVEEASREVIFNKIDKMEGSGGGVICVDKNGRIAMEFNTEIMYRAWATAGGQRGTAIEH
ncbi:MAG: isoaspartyl peptidase/L-asparaginase [Bacteroidales bacterium]|jgi:beta-aspartyl-peptidase (threonine type)|nr:isoaspartyl peptidase/L-asparaginase [Bacteroidales bacterium]NLH23253.1 isoaspartyl peptidase/L-asparaginase [Bacteroidales bacterium]